MDDGATTLSLTRPELELFLQGSQVVGTMPLAPTPHAALDNDRPEIYDPGVRVRTTCS